MILRRHVLVLHSGALGDFVLAWPLVIALLRVFAQSRVTVVTAASKGKLAEKILRCESTDIEAGWHQLNGNPAALPDRAAKLLAGASQVFSFVSKPNTEWDKNARALIGDKGNLVHLDPRPPADWDTHASDYLVTQLARAGSPVGYQSVKQILAWIHASGITPPAERAAKKGILLHPGSGAREKCWPIERFLDVAQHLARIDSVRFVIGPVERERFAAADLRRLESAAPVVSPADYAELADTLRNASLFVGNDSGPSHLAGIMGVATVALFAPTPWRVWRPLGPRVAILQRDHLADIPAMEVEQVASRLLAGVA